MAVCHLSDQTVNILLSSRLPLEVGALSCSAVLRVSRSLPRRISRLCLRARLAHFGALYLRVTRHADSSAVMFVFPVHVLLLVRFCDLRGCSHVGMKVASCRQVHRWDSKSQKDR
jgi:hypothetical protein